MFVIKQDEWKIKKTFKTKRNMSHSEGYIIDIILFIKNILNVEILKISSKPVYKSIVIQRCIYSSFNAD